MERFIGLMAGTSLDAIDAAAVEIERGEDGRLDVQLCAFQSAPFDAVLRERLREVCENGRVTDAAKLNGELGELFGQSALQVLAAAHWEAESVTAIGSHGQTICHLPQHNTTLQIGDIAVIAARTGIATIGDFRAADMAHGGQGAPLSPWADWHLYSTSTCHRVVQNLGGIANLTWLERSGDLEKVRAWDCGPGNMVIDECVRLATENARSFDENGAMAARGNVDFDWLESWLAQPFFAHKPPKSCGREEFGRAFAHQFFDSGLGCGMSHDDIAANATALTALSMARAYRDLPVSSASTCEVLLCGGGAKNRTLRAMLENALQVLAADENAIDWRVRTLEEIGGDAQAREAMAFALLAWAWWHGETNSLARVTGAKRDSIGGKMARP